MFTRVVFVSLALACAGAGAASAAGDEPLETQLVETATVRAQPLAAATASVAVIDREAIEALEAASVGEIVRFAAGVDLVGTGSRAGTAWAQVRGGDPNMTVVMIDGVPLNDLTDQVGGGIVDLNSLSVHHVERIEVARGPLSFFYGSSGLAGAINVITRRAADDGTSYGFEVGVGDADLVTGAASMRSGSANRRIYVGVSWDEEQRRIADERFEQQAVSTSMQFGADDSLQLQLTGRIALRETDDYPDASGGPVLGDGALRRSDHTETALGLDLRAGGASGEPRHAITLRWLHHSLDRSSPAIGFSVPPSVEDTAFSSIDAGWNVPVVDRDRHRVSLGVDVQHERGDNRSVLSLPPAFGGDVDGSYDLERTIGGAYVEYRAVGETVDLDVGLRVDVPDEGDAEFNPRVGIALRSPDAPVRLRASIARGFKLPGFFALASPAQLGGNPALEPERSSGFDASVEFGAPGSRASGSVGVFKTQYKDLVDFDFDSFSFVNRSRVKARGIEGSVACRLGDGWTLDASITRQDVEEPGDGARLRQRPKLYGAARLGWRPRDEVRISLDLQSVGDRFDRQLPVPGREIARGYGVAGMAAAWDLAARWTLWTRVDNVFDRDYETFIGFPGAGRSVRIGLRRRSG